MNKNPVKWFGLLFSFLTISCAGTELTHKKVSDAFKGRPVSNILVIAVTGNEQNRRTFETRFVAHLKSVGVDAVASEKAIPMPADLELKKETILNAVHQYKNDAVIITHLISKDKKNIYMRGSSAHLGYYGYYRSRYGYARNPGYSMTTTNVRLETNLYDVKTEKLMRFSIKHKKSFYVT